MQSQQPETTNRNEPAGRDERTWHAGEPTALYRAGLPRALARFVTKYVVFTGRASRSEFWWWFLTFAVVSIALSLVNKALVPPVQSADPDAILAYITQVSVLQLIWALLNFVGAMALTVRRLHDVGLSGWWWLIQLAPVAGQIAMVIIVALPTRASGARFDYER